MNVPMTQQEARAAVLRHEPEPQFPVTAGFFDASSFELMQRIAKGFSSSTLVPAEYRGGSSSAIGNCMIALNLARRIGADPLMVMQNLSIVQGRPSWSSKFLIASVNTCGRFTALRFEFFGTKGEKSWGCRASAVEKATGEVLVGADITWELAEKEGWTRRSGSKWLSMPQQMFIYRAGAWWVNAYAPEISMGLMTADESQDVGTVEYREIRREAPAAVSTRAPTINARLASFADESEVAEANGPIIDDEIPDFAAGAPATAAEQPADASAGTPAASGPSPVSSAAGDPDDPVEAARAAGRQACRDGVSYETVPTKFAKYKNWARAWQEGYQQEGERMEGEMNAE